MRARLGGWFFWAWGGVVLTGCVQARSDDFLEREREERPVGPVTKTPPPPPPKDLIPTTPPPPFDAYAKADSLSDDLACVKSVSELEAQARQDDAFALLVACAGEEKWRDLRRLLGPPWRGRLGKMPEDQGMVLLGRVIATRGGLFESDVRLCNLNRLELQPLTEAFQGRGLRAGSWVIFRAFAGRERTSKKDRRVELKELSRGEGDRGVDETGATITAYLPANLPPIEEGGQYIVVGRLDGAVGTNSEGYPHTKLKAVGLFRPGRTMPDLSP
ncbi:MAG: hypothetical protein IPG45_05305 [Deltaproteobacteria bacterium]|nr:hypothetical protein [Deltaproteobacteria bacterium]